MDPHRPLLSSIPRDLSDEARQFLIRNKKRYHSSEGKFYVSSWDDDSHLEWIIDSGTSHHSTPDSSILTDCSEKTPVPHLETADGSFVKVKQIGCVSTPTLSIRDVLHIPDFSVNLLSVSQLTRQGYYIVFTTDGCSIQEQRSKKIVGSGRRDGGIYLLNHLHVNVERASDEMEVTAGNVEPTAVQSKLEQMHGQKVKLISVRPEKNGSRDMKSIERSDTKPGEKKVEDNMSKEKDETNSKNKKSIDNTSGEKRDDDKSITFIYELDCLGCAKKAKSAICHFNDVEAVKVDTDNNTLTVTGKVDAATIQERIEKKIKKKIKLVSP